MDKLPFREYDFWAYLSSGFLLLLAIDYVAGTRFIEKEEWTVIQGTIAVSTAYVVGHLVSSLSANILERFLVGKLLGPPRETLFKHVKAPEVIKRALPGYYEPLPDVTISRVLEKGAAMNVSRPGEELFGPAYSVAKNDSVAMDRMQSFLNQYNFCRNSALVALIDAGLLLVYRKWFDGPEEVVWWATAAGAVGIGLFLRYLKFYRLFAVEVFTTFAYKEA